MSSMSTLKYATIPDAASGFRQAQQPANWRAPTSPVTGIEATPFWAWELYHNRGCPDLRRVASRLRISRSEVLRLIAEYKPTADILSAKRMALFQEASIYQVLDHPGMFATWKKCGEILSCRDPQIADGAVVSFWGTNAIRVVDELNTGFPVSYYVDDQGAASTLWLWRTGSNDQQGSAIGIESRSSKDLRLFDGYQRYRGTVGTVGAAIVAASKYMRAAAGLDV